MTIPEPILQQLNNELRNQPVWGLTRGMGSFLDVEIGPERPSGDGRMAGTWHLWVFMADWRIEQGTGIVVGSNDVAEFVDEALARLGLLRFESLTLSDRGDAAFAFTNGLRLVVFASALPDDDSEAWSLTRPDGTTISGGPAARWSLEGLS